jgi:hypothetical protein
MTTYRQIAGTDIAPLPFTATGTTTANNLADRFATIVNVKDFGAVGNGVMDNTTALQNAINAAESSGAPLFLPAGSYKTTSTLNVTASIGIFGSGNFNSVILPASNINGITVNIPNAGSFSKWFGPTFENFGIAYPSQATSGTAAISVTATGFEVNGSTYRNLWINQAWDGIHFVKASAWVVDSCTINDSAEAGIFVENQNNADNGDSTITNTTIFNPFVTGSTFGIIWRSSGGLRVLNNKINAMANGIQVQLASGAVTGDILIQNNSIEAYGIAGVQSAVNLFRLGATGTLHSVLIQGNQIGSFANAVAVPLDANGVWLSNLSILGNEVITVNTGSPNGFIVNSTTNFLICNNVLSTPISAGAAIITGASADKAVIGPNIKSGTWSANSISSTNTIQIAPN